MTAPQPGRRRRAPRELTERHREALLQLLWHERSTGQPGRTYVMTDADLGKQVGRYAMNTIASLCDRGYVLEHPINPPPEGRFSRKNPAPLWRLELTPLGRRIATELLDRAQKIAQVGIR